jgi:dethiobiotin synthetase
MRKIIIVGIGTDVGKTITSAILTQALNADYWKPIQTGEVKDTDTVKSLVSSSTSVFHPETYHFKEPASPHYASALEGQEIILSQIQLPNTANTLIVETAGGLLTPINTKQTNIDLIQKIGGEVVLVSTNYLGSINHTLSAIQLLNFHQIPCLGIIFSGSENKVSEKYILDFSTYKLLGKIPTITLNKKKVMEQALKFSSL